MGLIECRAQTVTESIAVVRTIVAPAVIKETTEKTLRIGGNIVAQSNDTKQPTRTKESSGSITTAPKPEGTYPPNSTNSDGPASSSNKQWRQPRSAREFASQANAVATMLLNGRLDLETARAYATLTRTIAQTLSTEVSKARFLEKPPDLSLDEDVWEE